MTAKIKLLVTPGANCSASYQTPYWQKYFDILPFSVEHSQHGHAVLTDFTDTADYACYGMPVIVDHLWDSAVDQHSDVAGTTMTLRAPDWIWIHEQWLGLSQSYNLAARSADQPSKFFLLPMNLRRAHRDQLLALCQPWLEHSVWSYVEQGRCLPGDEFVPHPSHSGTANDRAYRSEWYADTCFSLVSETAVDSDCMGFGLEPHRVFVSEKSFKPLAYGHPFVIQGCANTVKFLKSRGFAVPWNHSYDAIENSQQRLNSIVMLLRELYGEFQRQGTVLRDAETQAATHYNQQRFWDTAQTQALFEQQVVKPICDFVEAQ